MHNTLKKTATYTAFDKLRSLEQYNKRLVVDYGIDRQRVRQTFRRGSSTRTKRHFTPLYESITENGVTKNLHYLTAGTGLFAIFATQTNGESTMHYTLKDHQGDQARIDLSPMAKGIYMMHIEANGGQTVRKIVVE